MQSSSLSSPLKNGSATRVILAAFVLSVAMTIGPIGASSVFQALPSQASPAINYLLGAVFLVVIPIVVPLFRTRNWKKGVTADLSSLAFLFLLTHPLDISLQRAVGDSNIVAKVAVDRMEKVKETITWKIRRFDRVRSTLTMIVVEGQSLTTSFIRFLSLPRPGSLSIISELLCVCGSPPRRLNPTNFSEARIATS